MSLAIPIHRVSCADVRTARPKRDSVKVAARVTPAAHHKRDLIVVHGKKKAGSPPR